MGQGYHKTGDLISHLKCKATSTPKWPHRRQTPDPLNTMRMEAMLAPSYRYRQYQTMRKTHKTNILLQMLEKSHSHHQTARLNSYLTRVPVLMQGRVTHPDHSPNSADVTQFTGIGGVRDAEVLGETVAVCKL